MTDERTDAALVARAAEGDDGAFRALYRRHARPVYWIAHRLVPTASDAEDVTQETFVTAWRKLAGLELVGESLLPWLATICRFQASNRLRALRRSLTDSVDDTLPGLVSVEQQVLGLDLAERIIAEVGTLGELDQRIFRLCAVDGYAYAAAAAELGVGHGVVRNRLSRIRTRLRAVVGEEQT